ncbi:Uridine kinase [Acaryochloris thomasi RCC1774]|uniref:Uridine kinase n=1 Tax=Acaryochloris thomasi RCC1774 TaxID=1764569 RepID=A0A2W1JPL7_9CYAN|nr:uridine kinase [Acaryochloris thomasi]PZD72832.1 Uridine kinase [Acaryochloris thomasi RCC1774]
MTPTTIIGIGGGSGAGKTTLARAIVDRLDSRALLISHDRYYFHMACGNYDKPEALNTSLMIAHLETLRSGEPAELPIYDEINSCQTTETERVIPKPIILVEGIFVLTVPGILNTLDFKIFVETPSQSRLERRLVRDSTEKLRSQTSIIQEWHKNVMPTHQALVQQGASKADLIISGDRDISKTLEVILQRLDLTHA